MADMGTHTQGGVGGDVFYDSRRGMYVDRNGNRVNPDGTPYESLPRQGGNAYDARTNSWVPLQPTFSPSQPAAATSSGSRTSASGFAPAGAVDIDTLLGEVDRLNGPAGTPPPAPVYDPVNAGPWVGDMPTIRHPEDDPNVRRAAQDAAYASAKDRIGLQGRASLDALREEFGARGLSGSDMEARGTADLIGTSVGQLGQVARDLSAADLARANAVADASYNTAVDTAKTNYQGRLNQRQLDASVGTTNATTPYQGAITTRGQDIDAANSAAANRRASLQVLAQLRQSGVLY